MAFSCRPVPLYGREKDELYNNLYFGEPVKVEGQEVINKDIPLDPIGFDWNEFAKSKAEFFKIFSRKEILRNRVFNAFYLLGLAVSILSLIFTPSWFDIGTLALYIALFVFRRFWQGRHRPVRIISRLNKEPFIY